MEGVSDLGFRSVCVKRGADLTFTEMIRAEAILRNNKATTDLIDCYLEDVPTGLQLLVSKPDVLKQTLELITKKREEGELRYQNIRCIDLNFGCPSQDVISKGSGPALLKRRARMRELLTVLKQYSPVPCGIKIRLGLNAMEKKNKLYLGIIELVNELRLDWVTVHPKTADQDSMSPIDFQALKEIISIAKIPIIGNGFITDGPSAKKMFDLGCSGVMIARQAVINPWVFEEIRQYLKTGNTPLIKKDHLAALQEYEMIAEKYGTKEKYRQYHQKTFQDHSKGKLGYHSPTKNYP